MTRRANLIALGVAGAGLAGGVVAERVYVGRARRRSRHPEGAGTADMTSVPPRVVVASDGAELRVVERGHGRPVVLVHGVALSSQCWHRQMGDLAGDGRIIAYDQRGHGDSTIGGEGLTLARLAADLHEVLDRLDVRGGVLVGHSLGGMVALRLLADHPELAAPGGRVAALGLMSTSALPAGGRGIPGLGTVLGAARPVTSRAAWLASRLPGQTLPDSDLSYLLTLAVFGAAPDVADVDLTRQITSRVPLRVCAELVVEIARVNETATLREVSLPTTVIVGGRDVMTPVGHARRLVGSIPTAELVVLPGCGHMAMLERPEEVDAAIRQLLARADVPVAGDGAPASAPAPVR